MKTNSFLSAVLITLITGPGLWAAEPPPSKETALYLRLHATELVEKTVKVDVIAVRPAKAQPLAETYKIFHIMTQDTRNERFGGEIIAVVPKVQAEEFVKRYGVYAEHPRRDPRTKSLSAILRTTKRNAVYLDLDGTAAAAVGELLLPDDNEGERKGRPRAKILGKE